MRESRANTPLLVVASSTSRCLFALLESRLNVLNLMTYGSTPHSTDQPSRHPNVVCHHQPKAPRLFPALLPDSSNSQLFPLLDDIANEATGCPMLQRALLLHHLANTSGSRGMDTELCNLLKMQLIVINHHASQLSAEYYTCYLLFLFTNYIYHFRTIYSIAFAIMIIQLIYLLW